MKRITARIETYTDREGNQKGKYIEIGSIGQSNNGEFVLLKPEVDLAGVLLKQNIMNHKEGKPIRDSIMCSVFDNSQQGYQPRQQQATQQQAPQQNNIDDQIQF